MAVKASERVKRYQNPNGPTISTVERKVIEQDGLYFKAPLRLRIAFLVAS